MRRHYDSYQPDYDRRTDLNDRASGAHSFTPINNSHTNFPPSHASYATPQYGLHQRPCAARADPSAFTQGHHARNQYQRGAQGGYHDGRSGYEQGYAQEEYRPVHLQAGAYGQPSYGQGYGHGYGSTHYSQVQYSEQAPSWNFWPGGNSAYIRPAAPAQTAAYEGYASHANPTYYGGFSYSPSQWYGSSQGYTTWSGAGPYHAQQYSLTAYQDESIQPAVARHPASTSASPAPSVGQERMSIPVSPESSPSEYGGVKLDDTSTPAATVKKTQSKGRKRKEKLEQLAVAIQNGEAPADQQRLPIRHRKRLEKLVAAAQNGQGLLDQPAVHQKNPRLYMLKRPQPSQAYLQNAFQQPQNLASPQPRLVILDLNGTLLFRKKHSRSNAFVARPGVKEFLEYLFANHVVMVWSSARPENVATMCSRLFTEQQNAQLDAVWARDRLHLPPQAYNEKVQVYKQLSWVWGDPTVNFKQQWSQANTVLIDDTLEKAASEPYNIIQIDEFEAKPEQMKTNVLGQVTQYLAQLQYQANVSAYMRQYPFRYTEEAPAAAV